MRKRRGSEEGERGGESEKEEGEGRRGRGEEVRRGRGICTRTLLVSISGRPDKAFSIPGA